VIFVKGKRQKQIFGTKVDDLSMKKASFVKKKKPT
jgi:hypothetical protein